MVNTNTWVLERFCKTITYPDLWCEPILKKIEILGERGVYKVILRLASKNIVNSKWVYSLKWTEDSSLDRNKVRTVAKDFM